jgi:hypothetical protein
MPTDDRDKGGARQPSGVERHIAQQPAQGQTIPPDIDESHRPGAPGLQGERRHGDRRQPESDRRKDVLSR